MEDPSQVSGAGIFSLEVLAQRSWYSGEPLADIVVREAVALVCCFYVAFGAQRAIEFVFGSVELERLLTVFSRLEVRIANTDFQVLNQPGMLFK